MKRNYEKNSLLIIMVFIFVIFLIMTIVIYLRKNYRMYEKIEAVVITNNYVKSYIDSRMLEKLKSSSKFYIDNRIYNYKIIEINKNVMKKDNKKYHGILMEVKIPNKYKDNDTLVISVFGNKNKIYNMFKKCWESD